MYLLSPVKKSYGDSSNVNRRLHQANAPPFTMATRPLVSFYAITISYPDVEKIFIRKCTIGLANTTVHRVLVPAPFVTKISLEMPIMNAPLIGGCINVK